MTISDLLMIVAIILAPLMAIRVEKSLEAWRERKTRKQEIFKTLMRTRGYRLDHEHVTALNMIDLEFSEKEIIEKWREYMDVLNHPVHEETANKTQPEGTTYENDLLSTKLEEKFIDLLYEMSRALKYNFDKVHLSKSIYMPVAFSNILIENNTIRSSIIDILEGLPSTCPSKRLRRALRASQAYFRLDHCASSLCHRVQNLSTGLGPLTLPLLWLSARSLKEVNKTFN